MKVQALKKAVLALPQTQIDLQHHLAGGIYARTGFIPAGTVIVGCTHKKDHISILMGDASLTLDEGVQRVTGYTVLPTHAGMTRAIYAHSDCWMTTLCKTDETELDKIEDDLVQDAQALQSRNPELPHSPLILLGEETCLS